MFSVALHLIDAIKLKVSSSTISRFEMPWFHLFLQFSQTIFVVSMLQRLYFKETQCHRSRAGAKIIFWISFELTTGSFYIAIAFSMNHFGRVTPLMNKSLVPDTQTFASWEKVKVSDYTRVWITYGTTKIWITYRIVRNNQYF